MNLFIMKQKMKQKCLQKFSQEPPESVSPAEIPPKTLSKSNHFGNDFETSNQLLLKTWILKK